MSDKAPTSAQAKALQYAADSLVSGGSALVAARSDVYDRLVSAGWVDDQGDITIQGTLAVNRIDAHDALRDRERKATAGKTITVERFTLYPEKGRPGTPMQSYNYTVSGDDQLCQYGPGLSSLRSMLKRRFPGATIVETWATDTTTSPDEIAVGDTVTGRDTTTQRTTTGTVTGILYPRGLGYYSDTPTDITDPSRRNYYITTRGRKAIVECAARAPDPDTSTEATTLITDRDIRDQVVLALANDADSHNVDAIVETVTRQYGLVDLETVPDDEFWRIVADHAITPTTPEPPAGGTDRAIAEALDFAAVDGHAVIGKVVTGEIIGYPGLTTAGLVIAAHSDRVTLATGTFGLTGLPILADVAEPTTPSSPQARADVITHLTRHRLSTATRDALVNTSTPLDANPVFHPAQLAALVAAAETASYLPTDQRGDRSSGSLCIGDTITGVDATTYGTVTGLIIAVTGPPANRRYVIHTGMTPTSIRPETAIIIAPDATVADIEPLRYYETSKLDATELPFNAADVATVYVHGASYAGCWSLVAAPFVDTTITAPVGSIMTDEANANPTAAFESARRWIATACAAAGYRVAYSANRNSERPTDERPFFLTAMFLIDRKPITAITGTPS